MIVLPMQPHEDLSWKIQADGRIIWKFDLGLNQPYFPLEDEMHFQALSVALTQFGKEVWPNYQEQTDKAILYQGSGDFSRFFKWTERQEENFNQWKKEKPNTDEAHLRKLFCAEAFVLYFQMLAHRLPDELPLSLILDPAGLGTPAQTHHILSPERFAHFTLEPLHPGASTGICFPPDSICGDEALSRIDRLINELTVPYKPIYEPLLTEQWDGLDDLYVLSGAVTSQGERKLKGFEAAGGNIILY